MERGGRLWCVGVNGSLRWLCYALPGFEAILWCQKQVKSNSTPLRERNLTNPIYAETLPLAIHGEGVGG